MVTVSYQPSVRAMAQAGDLRAIAYWLNGFLAPQGIQVRVGRMRSGKLHLLAEFQRQPNRDRLVRFVCNRLYQLRSSLIGTVCIAARPLGSRKILWSQSMRLSTSKRSSQHSQALPPAPQTTSAIVLRSAQPSFTVSPSKLRRQRAIVLGGSAAAAFLIGGGYELMRQQSTVTASRSTRSDRVATAGDSVAVTERSAQNALDPTVTLTFSGDMTASRAQASAFSDTRSDISLANLDAPIDSATDAPFSADRIDLVNLASNRLRGGAIEQTIEQLQQAGISAIGAGRNQREARRPQILEVKGQRIAYLGYSDSDLYSAGSWRSGLNPAADRRIAEDIQAIRDQVDWVVVNYRWNQELAEYPGDEQVKLARFAIDQGADLVVGHHPNVLQGAEIYKGRAIAYSLGNFIFADSQANPNTDYDTAVLKVALRQSEGSANRQMRIEFVPIQVRQSQPAIAVGEDARRITQYMRQASGLFEQPLQSPTILDVRSAGEPPAVAPPPAPATPSPSIVTPSTPPSMPPSTTPAAPSDSFIAPPADPTTSAPFTTQPQRSPSQTKEIRLDDTQPPAAQTLDDRHITPSTPAPADYQPADSIEPPDPPAAAPPIEVTIDSVASAPAPPKAAIETLKSIETVMVEAPVSESAPLPAATPTESAESPAN